MGWQKVDGWVLEANGQGDNLLAHHSHMDNTPDPPFLQNIFLSVRCLLIISVFLDFLGISQNLSGSFWFMQKLQGGFKDASLFLSNLAI